MRILQFLACNLESCIFNSNGLGSVGLGWVVSVAGCGSCWEAFGVEKIRRCGTAVTHPQKIRRCGTHVTSMAYLFIMDLLKIRRSGIFVTLCDGVLGSPKATLHARKVAMAAASERCAKNTHRPKWAWADGHGQHRPRSKLRKEKKSNGMRKAGNPGISGVRLLANCRGARKPLIGIRGSCSTPGPLGRMLDATPESPL